MNEPRNLPTSKRNRTVWAIAALAAIVGIAAGYLGGTVDGDIPWPATVQETATYNTSTALTAIAGVLVLAALIIWGVRTRPKAGKAVLVITGALVATAVVFGASFAVGAL
ncbi:hypothetical protein M0722_11065 [Microbacterium sp. KSW4-16]|uniref:Uncharacterized protein n=1 Tax=Microbacterium aurugineum TaxID=2851642 RepID=A0ABY4J2S8_9MICO|nr:MULTISPECIES: hypothetical protein [Microbacterium]MCK8467734.1 hypothetical protein [Microbacterium aurugineum]QEA27902.1 hypothetical protein FGL91_04625 [Microbacterium sp. CBA3102]TCJ28477.1 hypothetical protein E0W80_05815 [Microbacterium sp. PI-1]UPL19320.1 hypothetical protein KV397_16875 [Microbacterium aurugineum]